MASRIDREKNTVEYMVRFYCKHKLKTTILPDEYKQLIKYAHNRLSKCKFGENKPVCKKCSIHCYATNERKLMRGIMRWVGPRMMFHAPIKTLMHFIQK